MVVKTKHFGEMDIEDSSVYEFIGGLPAFEQLSRFAVITGPGDDPQGFFYWLQSVEDESVAFVIIDMAHYNPGYNPLVNQSELIELGAYDPATFRVYNIAVIPEDVRESTVNLKAPIVLNSATGKGKQTICTNEDYTVRHYLFK